MARFKVLLAGKIDAAGMEILEKVADIKFPPRCWRCPGDASRRMSVWVAEDMVRVLKRELPKHPFNAQILRG